MDHLTSIAELSPEEQKATYENLLAHASSPDELRQIAEHLLDPASNIALFVARPLFGSLIERSSESEELLTHLLTLSAPRITMFEEQIGQLRETLATRYETQGEYLEAARALQNISLESGQRVIPEEYKLKIYVRIIRCLLEEEEAISADTYLNRATSLIQPSTDAETVLHFKLAQARIFDAKRKFMEASQKYYELSFSVLILESERISCLEAAITCGVLAPAGPARSRLLSTLYKDERSQTLATHKILEKMFLDRIIAPKEVEDFSRTIKSHQRALLADGTTVLSRAVIEHNLLSASLLYENIGIKELGELLNLEPNAAEKFARGMIESQRLQGEIDQVSGIIEFTTATKLAMEGTETERWDKAIVGLLGDIETLSTQIEKLFPGWVARQSNAMVTS